MGVFGSFMSSMAASKDDELRLLREQIASLTSQVSVLTKERDAFRSSLEDFFIQRPTGRYCCCGAEGNDIHAGICDDGNLALTNYEKAQQNIPE